MDDAYFHEVLVRGIPSIHDEILRFAQNGSLVCDGCSISYLKMREVSPGIKVPLFQFISSFITYCQNASNIVLMQEFIRTAILIKVL